MNNEQAVVCMIDNEIRQTAKRDGISIQVTDSEEGLFHYFRVKISAPRSSQIHLAPKEFADNMYQLVRDCALNFKWIIYWGIEWSEE